MTCCSAPMSSLSCHFKHYKRMKAAASGFAYLYMRRRAPLRSKQQSSKAVSSAAYCYRVVLLLLLLLGVAYTLRHKCERYELCSLYICMYMYLYLCLASLEVQTAAKLYISRLCSWGTHSFRGIHHRSVASSSSALIALSIIVHLAYT